MITFSHLGIILPCPSIHSGKLDFTRLEKKQPLGRSIASRMPMKAKLHLFAFFVMIQLTANSQDYWNTGGNNVNPAAFLGTLNESPLLLHAGNEFQAVFHNTEVGKPKIGFGIMEPKSTFHLHSEQNPPQVYDPLEELREGEYQPDIWLNRIRQGINGNSHVEFRLSNRESEADNYPGLLVGLTGRDAYIGSTSKTAVHVMNERSSLTFTADDANFFDPFNSQQRAYSAKLRMYLHGVNQDGLVIQGNQSQMQSTVTLVSSVDYGNVLTVHKQTESTSLPGTTTFQVQSDGRTAIGMSAASMDPNYLLEVAGKAKVCELKVSLSSWCDYVFDENYHLPPLREVEQFIRQHHHLPEIPTTAEVMENGVEIGNMTSLLLKKTEELTLYAIELEKKCQATEAELAKAKQELERLKALEDRMQQMEKAILEMKH